MQLLHKFMIYLHTIYLIFLLLPMSFGNRLRSIRINLNLTQIEMGDKLLMDQSAYSRYETDKTSPSIEIVKRVSESFSVNINWLLEIEDTDKAENDFTKQPSRNNNLDDEVIQFMLEQQKKLSNLLNKLGGG
jgi:transcriptional regulator with XRE-family HTH domain